MQDEHFLPGCLVRKRDINLLVDAARPEYGRVNLVRTVGGCYYKNTSVRTVVQL